MIATNENGTATAKTTVTVSGTGGRGNSGLTVTPISGPAPLTVSFAGTINFYQANPTGTAWIDFGDGSGQTISCQSSLLSCSINVSHTYAKAGVYETTATRGCGVSCPVPYQTIAIINVTGSTPSGAPVISSITPIQGPIGTKLTINGTGFSTTNNSVLFGAMSVATNVAANSSGTQLTFSVPDSLTPDCFGQPVCPASAEMLTPRTYGVSVENTNGISNALSFTVTGSGGEGITSPVTCRGGFLDTYIVPLSGSAPLVVNFGVPYSAPTAVRWDEIDFRDGSSISAATINAANCSLQDATWTHTYVSPGTYTPVYVYAPGIVVPIWPKLTVTVTGPTVTGPTASANDNDAQLANAYTALISVLQQLIATLSH